MYQANTYYETYMPVIDGPETYLLLLIVLAVFIVAFVWLVGGFEPCPKCKFPDTTGRIESDVKAIFVQCRSDAATRRVAEAIPFLDKAEEEILDYISKEGVYE